MEYRELDHAGKFDLSTALYCMPVGPGPSCRRPAGTLSWQSVGPRQLGVYVSL